jgi:hypothetical protein
MPNNFAVAGDGEEASRRLQREGRYADHPGPVDLAIAIGRG